MKMENEQVPQFSEEQKKYFARQLQEQSGKPVVILPREVMTHEQLAIQAHDTGDIDALKDTQVRAAYLQKFGVDEFGKLHLRATREKREKQRQAEQERLIAQNKARRNRIG